MYLYGKDYPTACACYCIGDEHGPYDATFVGEALEHEGSCAYCHHEECGQRYAVGIPSAYCFYSLWQVSRYHAYACHVAANCIQCLLCHCFFMSITQRECKMCGVHVKNRGRLWLGCFPVLFTPSQISSSPNCCLRHSLCNAAHDGWPLP